MWLKALADVPVDKRPQCNYSSLMPWAALVATAWKIKDSTTSIDIADDENHIGDLKVEISNFVKGLRKAISALHNNIKGRKSQAQVQSSRLLADTKDSVSCTRGCYTVFILSTLQLQPIKFHAYNNPHSVPTHQTESHLVGSEMRYIRFMTTSRLAVLHVRINPSTSWCAERQQVLHTWLLHDVPF